MQTRLSSLSLVLALVAAAACVPSPYQRFYQSVPSAGAAIASTAEPIRLVRGNQPQPDATTLMENGYVLVGYSSFNGPMSKTDGALTEARAVGATLVVLYGTYAGTVSGTLPLTFPAAPVTTTSTAQGTVTGPAGMATYSGNSTSTTTGGTTTYNIPYSVVRYNQLAAFWAKAKPLGLGVFARDLNETERQRLQRNRGIVVTVVTKDSPAFAADILEGDFILKVDGTDVVDAAQFGATLKSKAGHLVTLSILRNGLAKDIRVQLNP